MNVTNIYPWDSMSNLESAGCMSIRCMYMEIITSDYLFTTTIDDISIPPKNVPFVKDTQPNNLPENTTRQRQSTGQFTQRQTGYIRVKSI